MSKAKQQRKADWYYEGKAGPVCGWESNSRGADHHRFKIHWEPYSNGTATVKLLLDKKEYEQLRKAFEADKSLLDCWKVMEKWGNSKCLADRTGAVIER
jgi:hypothetical protein